MVTTQVLPNLILMGGEIFVNGTGSGLHNLIIRKCIPLKWRAIIKQMEVRVVSSERGWLFGYETPHMLDGHEERYVLAFVGEHILKIAREWKKEIIIANF